MHIASRDQERIVMNKIIWFVVGVFMVSHGALAQGANEVAASLEAPPKSCSEIKEILGGPGSTLTPEDMQAVEVCIENFNQAIANLTGDVSPATIYDTASGQIEFQTLVLQRMSRLLEPGGEFDGNVTNLETEIELLKANVEQLDDKLSREADELRKRIETLEIQYQSQTESLTELRKNVEEEIVNLTSSRPLLVIQLKAEGVEAAVTAFQEAMAVAQAGVNKGNEERSDPRPVTD